MKEVERILQDIEQGDPVAADELLPVVYHELRILAAQKIARQLPGHTLQPTALVHEAWLRLAGGPGGGQFDNRAHFFAAAAEAMRRILIDSARRKQAQCRGGGQKPLDIEDVEIAAPTAEDKLLAVNEALDKLALHDKVKADLVKLRYFVGMNFDQAAQALGISVPTAKRHWAFARAWLFNEFRGSGEPGAGRG
jgi:RNA polymerase sigma factor (TIGR02999 family)